jgi:phosphopantetheinyl transferase
MHRPAHQRQSRLLRLWTGKEAASKALGLGIAIPFRTLEVDTDQKQWRTSGRMVNSGEVTWPAFLSDHVMALADVSTPEPE